MAATQNLPQHPQHCNFISITPKHGVVTVYGYGIAVRVDRGHLSIQDGIGADRRKARFPRVGHGLRRLVVIGSDGMVSLAALRWLADQDAAFVMLDRMGSVIATTGPVRSSDARLRRAQAMAHQSGAALQIARDLIGQKLEAQEMVAYRKLNNSPAVEAIARAREAIPTAQTIEAIRLLESRGAYAYWGAWNNLPINFPKADLRRVPDHWRTFRNRVSPLTGSPRLAANPLNAMLNYLYALLESEARLAVAALGLDPGLGVLHMDAPARDSLACDVMEPVRPMVDAYLLDWISRETLRREWFFEQRDGTCRLIGPFAVQLSKTIPTWSSAVAPFAEMVSRTLWSTIQKPTRQHLPATRLTQLRRREAKGVLSGLPLAPPPRPDSFCNHCGAAIGRGRNYCVTCAIASNTVGLVNAARQGRIAAQSDQAQSRRADTQRAHAAAKAAWKSSDLPGWLNEDVYHREIQPRLRAITLSVLASTLGISIPYAVDVRAGRRVPHPRHWQSLARLVGISRED
jgi:CRISPR-associated endonuclease Cas1